MDRAQLWKYKGNEDAISRWLDGWLTPVSPKDLLTSAWLYGEAEGDSGWTRDQELSEWIEASKNDRHAWEGVKRLLQNLRKHDQAVPVTLLLWALDVADGTRKPPNRRKGRDATQNCLRNRSIVMAIRMLQEGGLPATSNTGTSACHVVAEKLHLSYEAVRTVWQKNKGMTLADYLRLDRGF